MPHGHKVRIQCLRGFTVVGEELSECFRGRLLQQLGQCVPSFLKFLLNGTQTYRDGHIGIFQGTNSYPTDFGTYGHWVLDSME